MSTTEVVRMSNGVVVRTFRASGVHPVGNLTMPGNVSGITTVPRIVHVLQLGLTVLIGLNSLIVRLLGEVRNVGLGHRWTRGFAVVVRCCSGRCVSVLN